MNLQGAHILLGVTGGIAAYKAADLCSKLVQAGAQVQVVMTPGAAHFIAPLTFQTLTAHPVSVDTFQLLRDTDMAHISLSAWAHILVIVPATANTIAKLAHGLADNLLTSTALACPAPLIIAPAMDADMWAHPATQQNIATLHSRGAIQVGPAQGRLASGRVGAGRLASNAEIIAAIRQALGRTGKLAGKRVLVTAGGTREPLDPVRHISNRSSGKMGYAMAEAARDFGAQVTLVSASTGLAPVYGIQMVSVQTAQEMYAAVLQRVAETDLLVMAAAVADYRPKGAAAQKIKKADDDLTLELERTPDILMAVAQRRQETHHPAFVVGFAAETENLLANAASKLASKHLDLIVANDVSSSDSGFDVDQNRVILLRPDGAQEPLPLLQKTEVAERILERIAEWWR
ncbi:MAG: bifunctional phosphopantothenoylcysteine decarboxylase/phosphopantothenate--cysteine ligase CoaBC [Chloroflexi bacterium]|nr:bifunctional phosphopantothenoylcysteine decarboxylase/phosphopantothenate--cysteine ligase CoaBC [Chloroflexota bacterium]